MDVVVEHVGGEIDLLGSHRATFTELRLIFRQASEGKLRPVIHATFPLRAPQKPTGSCNAANTSANWCSFLRTKNPTDDTDHTPSHP